jgi:excisionase family DNA binding protein
MGVVVLLILNGNVGLKREGAMAERRKGERRNGDQDKLLTEEEVADLAGVPTNTVRYWRQKGVLPFVKVGRHPRIWRSVFQSLFHKPARNGPWELLDESDKIRGAGDIRRKQ